MLVLDSATCRSVSLRLAIKMCHKLRLKWMRYWAYDLYAWVMNCPADLLLRCRYVRSVAKRIRPVAIVQPQILV